ncbi:hypothetical protein DUI87_06997 [Hirundo rustica rustica]|uniref:Uncharacterized protein n=1 Tax=Hirundo rustica rustica TaxID=333673 RepID=A0A3M0KQE5_HIRRU|nr:hypothetical protein DUI87_06997 [Hirundo rustica rustica]
MAAEDDALSKSILRQYGSSLMGEAQGKGRKRKASQPCKSRVFDDHISFLAALIYIDCLKKYLGCGAVDMVEGRDGIQRGLGRLERWGCENLINISEVKCKVQHLGQGNPKYKHRLGVERRIEEKDLGEKRREEKRREEKRREREEKRREEKRREEKRREREVFSVGGDLQ